MRKRFTPFLEFGQTPIEDVKIPTKSRDELPPTLAGLQWIFITPELNELVFTLLEEQIIGDKQNTGRPGMDLWHILVLGVVRLTLNCDYDRLEHIANNDKMVRRIMGVSDFDSDNDTFHHKTIGDNVCHIDEAMLADINALVAQYGLAEFKKNDEEKLEVKFDSYVLETNVHYPTDLNLLWDACRKSIEIILFLCNKFDIKGWRKGFYWKCKLKKLARVCSKANKGGGAKKKERVEKAAQEYLDAAYALEGKVNDTITMLRNRVDLGVTDTAKLDEVVTFQNYLILHIDLVDRRLIKGETIPHGEKMFSLFEEHTELIKKGKARPPVEFGHRLLIATDQNSLILDYKIMDGGSECAETIPLVDRLFNRYGEDSINSISCDKGFSSEENREILELYIPEVIFPKKGRLNQAELERQSSPLWRNLSNAHSAVESDINCLEQHGLDRCPDKGYHGYKRYTGLGILAYNLHKIGALILEEKRKKESLPVKPKKRRPVRQSKAA